MTKTPRSHKRKSPLDLTEANAIRHREPLLPEDPAVGIKFACALLDRHKVTVLRQLNPNLPEFDAELAACAYRESEASPWKFIASRLYAFRELLYARSQERLSRSTAAGAE
jgi:hypothetical protein